jgi:4-hydroxybenzoyl-CoA thioesterase
MSESFVVRRRILFGDCDPGGIVYTPRFSHFAVEAALDFISARLGTRAERRLRELGVLPPARAFSLEFLRMVTWDDELEIGVSVAEIGNTSVTLALDGRHNGLTAFTARLTLVCVALDTRKPTALPAELRAALA